MKKSSLCLLALLAALLPSMSSAFELYPQLGHTSDVSSVAYSPDGLYIASASDDKTVRLWEVSSGKELRSFKGHTLAVSAVAFSPDGSQLVSASQDSTVRLWDVSTGKERLLLEHTFEVSSVAFSPDGLFVATASGASSLSKSHKIILWELSTGKKLRTFEGHTGAINAVAFNHNGKAIASASDDKTVRLWGVTTGNEISSLGGHTAEVLSVVFSPDGKLIASAGKDKKVRLWNLATREKEARSFVGHTSEVNALAFSPDSLYLASAGGHFPTAEEATTQNIPESTTRLWEVSSGKELRSFKGHTHGVFSVAFSPDGSRLVTAGGYDKTARLWEVSSGKQLNSFTGRTDFVNSVAYSPDGKYVAVGSVGAILLWEVNSGKQLRSFVGHGGLILSVAFSPDGKYLVSSGIDFTMRLWEVSTGKELRSFAIETAVWSVAFSPDSLLLASAAYVDHTVRLWEVSSGKQVRGFKGHTSAVKSVAFSPDGLYLASAGGSVVDGDNTARLWELSTGKELRAFKGHTGEINSVAFSPDSKQLASASQDKTVRLWEVASGKEIRSFKGHTLGVNAVAFSPDGSQLVSGGDDEAARLWALQGASSGKEIRSFVGHNANLQSVSLSPDGLYFASGSWDGTARLWRVDGAGSMVLVSSVDGEWLIYNDEGYFDSSPGGVDLVAAVEGMHGYNIEQLALKNNRPDLILKKMGLGAPVLLNYYYKRYLNRLKKAKLDEARLDGSLQNLPMSAITEAKVAPSGQEAELAITLTDKSGIKSYQFYVNGVAGYEGFGKEVSGTRQEIKEKIALTQGVNRIEVSAFNVGGQESFRALAVLAGPAKPTKDLYFVGFGVSDYTDKDIPDLAYADKDARELGEAFNTLQGYEHRFIKTYTDKQVTKASIQEAKELFKKAKPQDTVVLFIAGHGMHDRDELATYYYIIGSTKIDINKDGTIQIATATAVSFEEIEGLLSGISAKQKLFLMDTCESGERDDTDAALAFAGEAARSLDARAIGVSKVKAAKKPNKAPKKAPEKAPIATLEAKSAARPWLLERDRYIYQDLSKRTGALVFSSSKGGEYSYEDPKLENGLFTESILEGLLKKAADENKDGIISTDELRAHVIRGVTSLSKDLQHPTVDRDNLSLKLSFVP